jgi:hypothetical protein
MGRWRDRPPFVRDDLLMMDKSNPQQAIQNLSRRGNGAGTPTHERGSLWAVNQRGGEVCRRRLTGFDRFLTGSWPRKKLIMRNTSR